MDRTKGLLILAAICIIILGIALACVLNKDISAALYGAGGAALGGFLGILETILKTPLQWGSTSLATAAIVWAVITITTVAVAYVFYNFGLKKLAARIKGTPSVPQTPQVPYTPRGSTLSTDELPQPQPTEEKEQTA